ncbi:MAG: hypothetical protein KR126chlam3_01206, partial [Chlamydiae bacterium]|nr:hypothetical protein [Chlamydiota bacterium]
LVPSTLESIGELNKSSGGLDYHFNDFMFDKAIEPAEEFHYAVLTKDILPGSRRKPFVAHNELVESKGYEMPPVLDVVTAILWENRRTGERLLGNNPETYTRCQEKIGVGTIIVGGFAPGGLGFAPGGLCVDPHYYDNDCLGVVGFRKF